ncbi:MAG: ATP-binding protein [Arenicellales bacterium]
MNTRLAAKILLVDDKPYDGELAALVLQHHLPHAELITVEDAIEFAEHLALGGFDLVITERQLKWAEGSRVLESIKRLYPDCPVVFFSAEKAPPGNNENHTKQPDAQIKKGSDGFLHLPVTVNQLLTPRESSVDEKNSTGPLVDRLPVGVFSLNQEGKLNCLNGSCKKIFRLDSNDEDPPLLQSLLADDAACRKINHVLQHGETVNNLDVQLCLGDDTPHWIRLDLWPKENALDGTYNFEGSVSDISFFKDTVSSLSRDAAELTRSNADLEKFAYVTSHDLQEPLSHISRYASLLHERSDLDDDSERFMGHIIDSSKRLQSMVDDILEYSRAGTPENEFEPVDIGELADSAAKNLGNVFREKNASYKHSELPVLRVDGRQIKQLFQNLFSNALKFHGDKPPRILVTAKEKSEHWEFAVQDNGIGLEKKDRRRIFDMFQRLHTSKEYPGTGIGLAVCRSIVERHGGTIGVKSIPGKGSIFVFTIRHKSLSRKA